MKEWLVRIGLSALAALAPIHAIMISVGVLIAVDLATGMMAANRRGEKLSSAAMRRTVSKILVYQLAVISGFIVEKYMLSNVLPISKMVAGVIGMVELKSILENSNTVVGQDIFKMIIGKLGSDNDKKDEGQK